MSTSSTITPEGFTVSRVFTAPRERVWKLWTDPAQFSVWFGTDAVTVPLDTLVLDARPGGQLRATMLLPDGNTIDWEGEFRELDEPEHLALTLTDAPGTDPGEPITADLREVPAGTELTLSQPRHDFTDEQIEQTIAGYSAFFDTMERVLN